MPEEKAARIRPLKRILENLVDLIATTTRKALDIDQKLRVGNSTICLPPDHLLRRYQRSYKQYDRFLPHLAKYLEEGSVVVDVGANVGDTVAAMVAANSTLRYVCVDADDVFFDYLKKNTAIVRQQYDQVAIDCYKCLVGQSVTGVTLQGVGGTKHAERSKDANALTSRSLDALVDEIGCSPLGLIKSDVDGFDYDVIDSAVESISKHNCLLFFECQFDNETQLGGYRHCIDRLQALGYEHFAVFDNYGGLVTGSATRSILFDLMEYVRGQNDGDSFRTVHYFDILAYMAKHESLVTSVLTDYQ